MTVDVIAHYYWGMVLFLLATVGVLEAHKVLPGKITRLQFGFIGTVAGLGYYYLLFGGFGLYGSRHASLSSTDQQHVMISVVAILAGLSLLFTAFLKQAHFLLRASALTVVAVVLFLHTQAEGHTHAGWLVPYHQAMAAVLLLVAISFGMVLRPNKFSRNLLFVAPIGLMIVASMLLLYKDPGGHGHSSAAPVETCQKMGKVLKVTLSDEQYSPNSIQAKRCDVLQVTGVAGQRHQVAFGDHSGHDKYGDYQEKPLEGAQSVDIVLVTAGTFDIHDHFNDEATAKLSVSP